VISPTCQANSNAKIILTVTNSKGASSLSKEIPIVMGVTVSGKVLYAGTSIPIPGVIITIGPFSSITGNDGTFVFFDIASGSNILKASKSGFDNYESAEEISGVNNAFTISLANGIETKKLYGSVKTIDSIPLNGIRVVMLNDDKTESGLSDLTDAGGNYHINNVPPGNRYFKFTNESNSNKCYSFTNEIYISEGDKKVNVRMKIQRQIDMLQNGWEFKTSDLSAPFNGTAYVLMADATNTTKYFRPAYCCPIPLDADDPQAIIIHKLTGTLKTPSEIYYKSPASTQFYMNSDCSNWVVYSTNNYTYWSTAITSFQPDYFTISNSYKGGSIKFSLGLFRWAGLMPLWEIESLYVSYYY
jgi:hypothetical protein